MSMYNQKNIPFKAVLDALLNENEPFPPVYLHRFSDPDPKDLDELKQIWLKVSEKRRGALLEDLEVLAETDTLLSFDDLAQFALKDPDPQVRTVAIRLLWESEDKRLAPIFIKMMDEDSSDQVRAAAANALGKFVYLGELEEIPEDLLETVENSLLKAADDGRSLLVRRRALESLGFSSREEVIPLLEAAYAQNTTDWLSSALYAMGRSADKRWAKNVLKMLKHPEPDVRVEAVRAAGELELAGARNTLLHMLADEEDDEIRMASIWSLSQIGGEAVRAALERLLEDIEDEEEEAFIEDALENLSFTEDMQVFNLFDVDLDQEPRIVDPDEEETDMPPDED